MQVSDAMRSTRASASLQVCQVNIILSILTHHVSHVFSAREKLIKVLYQVFYFTYQCIYSIQTMYSNHYTNIIYLHRVWSSFLDGLGKAFVTSDQSNVEYIRLTIHSRWYTITIWWTASTFSFSRVNQHFYPHTQLQW